MAPEDVVNRTWLPPLIAGLSAIVSGLGTTRVLDGVIRPEVERPEVVAGDAVASAEGGGKASPSALPRVRKRTETQYLDAILSRNIFDPAKVGQTTTGGPGGKGGRGGAGGADDDGVALSDLKVTLKGTMVATPASMSIAFIQEEDAEFAKAYPVGSTLHGADVTEVGAYWVRLTRADGRVELLILGEEGKQEGKKRTTSSKPAPDSDSGVEQISETEFVVSRAMLDEHLKDLDGLSRMGRAILHRGPDGEFDGYRLSAVRRGSLGDTLGIRNGDIIHSVNGVPLNSLQSAMQALQQLQSDPNLKFEVTRRGQPVALNYEVR